MVKTVGDKFEAELENLLPREYDEVLGLATLSLCWHSGREGNTETWRGGSSHICMICDLDHTAEGPLQPWLESWRSSL